MTQDSVFLYGSEETPAAARHLAAGPLDAQLGDDGALRAIRWRGVEVLRALTFLVRTAGWGTPAPRIDALAVDDARPDRFAVSYEAQVSDGDARLAYRIEIEADACGRLEARATIRALTDFSTNRTGFVVLHPLAGVAGEPVDVEHVDGRRETVTLPAAIEPAQPLREIRALSTFPLAGVRASVRLEGDTFEMEDQRNWSDASFKTYSRPLAQPFPYRLAAGSTLEQRVTLSIATDAARGAPSDAPPSSPALSVRVHRPDPAETRRVPRIGIALPGEREQLAQLARRSPAVAERLRDAAPNVLFAHFDASLGHGAAELHAIAELARSIGAPVTLELIVADDADPDEALAATAALAASAGLRPAALAVHAKSDERSFQPGAPRPPSPEPAALYRAARVHFPGIALIGGSPALFTELNRRRPPAGLLDAVIHASCPIVHDASDSAVMQTLETLPWIAASVRSIAGQSAYHIGPVAIGTRINPYGDAPTPNPDNRRVGLAKVDPRQRGLFGAAWYLGYAAAAAREGVAELTLTGSVGAFGLVYSPQEHAQPWFDQLGGERTPPAVFPAWHVVRALARAAGQPVIGSEISDPSQLAALAWVGEHGARLALANLTAVTRRVRIDGWPDKALSGRLLDARSFARATLDPAGWQAETSRLGHDGELELPPYALAFLGD